MRPHRRTIVLSSLLALALGTACTAAAGLAPQPTVPNGFTIEIVARLDGPRELAAAPNGDLIVGTNGDRIAIVPHADGTPGAVTTFARVGDAPAAGVALAGDTLYIGSQFGVWRVPYHAGEVSASRAPEKIASVRTSGRSSDHVTTSVALADGTLYASVGSSCNACDPELDATRASIRAMHPDGSDERARAVHIRNAIALAVDPATQQLWAGVAGQDELTHGHPYEIFDDVSAQSKPVADYGWPHCYEDRRPVEATRTCAGVAVPRVVLPAYETPIGAAFYPAETHGAHAFPQGFRGGAFVALHGSWHRPLVPPRVVFVPLHHDEPAAGVDWNDPNVQWHEFASGFQTADGTRIGRPTGVAVGADGSLFVADDGAGVIYRIRPVAASSVSSRSARVPAARGPKTAGAGRNRPPATS